MIFRSHLDDVREFTSVAPRWVRAWGRADVIYRHLGHIVRWRKGFWVNGVPGPYGMVVEASQASLMAVLWSDGTEKAGRSFWDSSL